MKILSVLWIIFYTALSPNGVNGQVRKVILTGRILDTLNQPISNVRITLHSTIDSNITRSSISDNQGQYKIDSLLPDTYILIAKHIAYSNYLSDSFSIGIVNFEFQDIRLKKQPTLLKEVTVTAGSKALTFQQDRTILNVNNSINSSGSTAFELLSKAPGARLINNDEISINGKNSFSVYINGNNSNLTGKELSTYLKTINSSNIDAIEIINSPSAKFDSNGSGGVINIKTKKINSTGFVYYIGLTNALSYYKPKYDAALNLNYRSSKINYYINYNGYKGDYLSKMLYLRQQLNDEGTITKYDQTYTSYNSSQGNNIKIGADLNLTRKSTLGIIFDGTADQKNINSKSSTLIYKNQIDSNTQDLAATNHQPLHNSRLNYNINYHYADSIGNELSLNATYGKFDIKSESVQPNSYLNSKDQIIDEAIYESNSKTNILIKSANADYSRNLLRGKIEAGFKMSQIKSDNDLKYYLIDSIKITDPNRTNHFIYNESISSGYAQYSIKFKYLTLQLGTRIEHLYVKGVLSDLNNKGTKTLDSSYVNIFPNASILWKIDEDNSIYLNYNKRVDRPKYQDLNPFELVVDELNYEKGNPFLKPQYTNDYKITYKYKSYLSTSFNYTNTRDFILWYRDTLQFSKTFKSPINLTKKVIISFSTSLQIPISDWWDLSTYFNMFHQEMEGNPGNSFLRISQNSFTLSGVNKFKLQNNYSMEISGFYNSKYLDAPAIVKPQWSIDYGVQKTLFNNSTSIKFSISDVFNSWSYKLNRDFGGLSYYNYAKWETRQFKVFISYRFGNSSLKRINGKDSGIEDEKKRIRL